MTFQDQRKTMQEWSSSKKGIIGKKDDFPYVTEFGHLESDTNRQGTVLFLVECQSKLEIHTKIVDAINPRSMVT